MPKAAVTAHSGMEAGSGVQYATPKAAPPPIIIPTPAPAAVRTPASTRNCHRISRRVAPTALRTPISRVRSVTDTRSA